jgi:hypothetical protein
MNADTTSANAANADTAAASASAGTPSDSSNAQANAAPSDSSAALASAGQLVTSMERGGVVCGLRPADQDKATVYDMSQTPTSANPCGVGAMTFPAFVPERSGNQSAMRPEPNVNGLE